MDLPHLRGILPHYFGDSAAPELNRARHIVGVVAGSGARFAQGVPPLGQYAREVDNAVVVGDIVADDFVITVEHHELHAEYRLFGYAVDFEDSQSRFLRVRDFERGVFTRSHGHFTRRRVMLIANKRLCFHNKILARFNARDVYTTACVCGVYTDLLAVRFSNLELNARERLSCPRVGFENRQTRMWRVKHFEKRCLAALHKYGLRLTVKERIP